MAERKLRIDAAEAVAIPHPRIRMPAPDDESPLVDRGSTDFVPKASPFEVADNGPVTNGAAKSTNESLPGLERAVRQKLLSHPDVRISSLTVRQIEGGVCLDGVLEVGDELPDIERLVRSAADVERVWNRLVMRPPDASPD